MVYICMIEAFFLSCTLEHNKVHEIVYLMLIFLDISNQTLLLIRIPIKYIWTST